MTLEVLPHPGTLRKLLRYDPETGKLFWRRRTPETEPRKKHMKIFNLNHAGREAFTYFDGCRCQGGIFGKIYPAHRVIWAMAYGEWPDTIDHINGNPRDNRLGNLRNVTQALNMRNIKKREDNTSGVCGVYLDKRNGHWYAQITTLGHTKNLGTYPCITAAIVARKKASVKHGFTDRHGT